VTSSFTPEAPYRVDVTVYNPAGEVVRILDSGLAVYNAPTGLDGGGGFVPDVGAVGSVKLGGDDSALAWDGKSSGGQMVQSGNYVVVAKVTDSFGHITSFSTSLTVVRREQAVEVGIYNSAGELVRTLSMPSGGPGVKISRATLSGGSVLSITSGSSSVTWDGRDDAGRQVQSGDYVVKVTEASGQGQIEVFAQAVTVLDQPQDALASAKAAPNPSTSSGPVQILLDPATPSSTEVVARVYDLAGELVGQADNSLDPSIVSWKPSGTVSSGIYFIRLTATDTEGRVSKKVVKVVLLK
jgi:flagellar hook assembly protein FlgD